MYPSVSVSEGRFFSSQLTHFYRSGRSALFLFTQIIHVCTVFVHRYIHKLCKKRQCQLSYIYLSLIFPT
jgi:hypothetical protein